MEIKKTIIENNLNIKVSGRLDTITAPDLESELVSIDNNINKIVLDFSDLQYISSAGLRILIQLKKKHGKDRQIEILNMNEEVSAVLEITGLKDLFLIESNSLSTTFKADKNQLDNVIDYINKFLEDNEANLKIVTQIDVCVEELFINVCSYAYEADSENKDCEIELRLGDDKVYISLIDGGKEFNPLEKEDPNINLSAEERGIGGLGIFIVKKSMDDVIYKRENNKNIITIVKKIK